MLASLKRIFAVFNKEIQQMKRDRLTFGMMFGIPILQLILFGFAINTNPKDLPTAVYTPEQTPIIRSMLSAMQNSGYFNIEQSLSSTQQSDALLQSRKALFVVHFPANFTADLLRGIRPKLLVQADATDPSATSNALAQLPTMLAHSIQHQLPATLIPTPSPYELVIQAKYNPEQRTQYNIVPALLGVILTLTLIMVTGISMTRELERGTMENLLALPAKPYEVMLGKITPYIAIGLVQSGVILSAAYYIFGVPFNGSFAVLVLGMLIFMLANLALGFTFSTIAKSQLQAMQLTFFFFLPSLLLSGFMFPFKGMPLWAQYLGEVFPLTQFLRIIRGVILKGADINSLQMPLSVLLLFTLLAMGVAMLRYRKTLD